MNADSGIGRPRATGNETQAGLARQLAPGRRHIGSPALLPAEHEIKGVGVVDHRVENGKIGFAGHPEATCRAKRDKAVHEKLAAVSGPAIRHLTCLRVHRLKQQLTCQHLGDRRGKGNMAPARQAGNVDAAVTDNIHAMFLAECLDFVLC